MSAYRAGSGAILLPSWPDRRAVAMAEHHHDTRRVRIWWLNGADARAALEDLAGRFMGGEGMAPLENRRRETVGFAMPGRMTIRAIPVAVPWSPDLSEGSREFAMCDWRLGEDALIQATSFDEFGDTVCVDDVSGADAWDRLTLLACDPRAEPVGDAGAVYGLAWPDGTREEFWDCDECSWQSYLQCLAEVMQDHERQEGGE